MQHVSVQDYFREALAYIDGVDAAGKPHERNYMTAWHILNECLNFNIGNIQLRYSIGSLALQMGYHGLAIQMLSQVVAQEPGHGPSWNNLGLAWKNAPEADPKAFDKAEQAMKQAAKHFTGSELADVYCNLAALKVGRNMPEDVLRWADKALEINPDGEKYIWHKALALLELRRWDEAWDAHELRLRGGAPGEIATRNYHGPDGMTPEWDGKSPGLVVIHGEQGMGDEIMFASCIPDALKVEGCTFILEPSPRLEKLFQRSFPMTKVYGTDDTDGRRWVGELGKPDYKIALGSLPKFYRRADTSFPGTSYLIPDKAKRVWWGDKLRALGRKPNIGIAWQGGVSKTRYDARSFHPINYAPMFQMVDANWISLQYDPTAQHCVNEVREKLGVKLIHWPKAVEQKDPDTGAMSDLDEMAALISKLDCVVTVNQTAVHIAGALGIPCITLTPSEPSWRYGAGDSQEMPWYDSVRQVRQAKGTSDWAPVIEEAACNLQALLKVLNAAASA